MKALICSLAKTERLEKILLKHGLKIVNKNPDFVICYGGDGTALYAERKHLSIPKLLVKKTKVCRKCDLTFDDFENAVEKFIDNDHMINEEMKLEAIYKTRN